MEPARAAIVAWLDQHTQDVAASDFTVGEFVSALGLKGRMRDISADQALGYIAAAERWLQKRTLVQVSPVDIATATSYLRRFDLGLRLPDAIHIAVARRIGGVFVSLDKQQLVGARSLGIGAVDPLGLNPGKDS